MKKGICLGCLPSNLSLKQRFELAKDAGLDGIEISTLTKIRERKQYRTIAEKTGIEIHSIMGGLGWQCPLSHPDPKVRQKGMDSFIASLQTAEVVGATAVLCVPGVVNEETRYEECWKRSMQCIKKLAKAYEKKKIYLLVENVWNKFLLSPVEFRDFIDKIGSPYVQAYFDVGNIVLYGIPQHWIKTLGKRIKKVHIKGFDAPTRQFVYLTEGTIDWVSVVRTLRSVGYDDYLTIEMPPYKFMPELMVRDTSRHLDAIFATAGDK